ncbi:MAG: hypothetical protein IV107_23190 [Paucibacter sp.]|nr:hypothetical protein [Roseateles sp.]
MTSAQETQVKPASIRQRQASYLARTTLTTIAAATLVACGGSDDDAAAPPAPEPVPVKTAEVAVRVVAGPLEKALVCVDANANGACDDGEVSAKTNADGMAKLTLAEADVGKHGLIAMVPVGAIDKDHGEVKTAYVMRSPADATALISPLTTLVQSQLDLMGGKKSAEAVAALQEQLGFKLGLLDDYTKKDDAEAHLAGDMARLHVLFQQQQVESSKDAKDAAGVPLPASAIAALIAQVSLARLNQIGAAAVALSQAGLEPAAKRLAMQERAAEMAKAAGLTAANVAGLITIQKLPAAPEEAASAPAASMSLRWLNFSDKGNYDYRSFHATAEQNTPDANGKRRYTEFKEYRWTEPDGQTQLSQFGVSSDGRGDKSWKRTGSDWFACPAEFVHEATLWDKDGKSESSYCKSSRSSSQRKARDISGLTLLAVVKDIRAYPHEDEGPFSAWGPDPVLHADALAVNFPAKSKLYYQSSSNTVRPISYSSSTVSNYVDGLAQALPAQCELWTSQSDASMKSQARSLEKVIAANPGLPCVYATDAATGSSNEAWAASTLRLGRIYDALFLPPSSHYVAGQRDLRYSFGADKSVRYWSCLVRASDYSPRNCKSLGSGSYTVEALGDARVLRLTGLPSLAASLSRSTILVERADKVYFGYQDKPKLSHQIRLNKEAADALFTALMLPH